MFNTDGSKKDYSKISLEDFSDDDSDDGNNNKHNKSNNGFNFHDEENCADADAVENDDYVRNQQILMKQQDVGLDVLSQSVMRLGEMSTNISEELGQQNKMLDSMETDLDEAGDNLDIVTRSTKQLIAKSGGMSSFCLIAALSMVVLVLVFLVLYT